MLLLYTPCLSIVLCFSLRILFLVSKMCTMCLDIMYRYSFLWCIHVRLIFCNPNLCSQVKVFFFCFGLWKNIHSYVIRKTKSVEKESQQITIIRFLSDKYCYIMFICPPCSIKGASFILQILCVMWNKNHPFQLCP